MAKTGKRVKENSIRRFIVAGVAVLMQFLWFMSAVLFLNRYFAEMEIVIHAVAIFLALLIIGNRQNSTFKETWLFVILAAPVFGVVVYFLFGNSIPLNRERKKYQQIDEELLQHIPDYQGALRYFQLLDANYGMQASYLSSRKNFPIYANGDSVFYGNTKSAFAAQLAAIRQAKRFIFMEYFAVDDGYCFAQMFALLQQKAKEGIDVRIIYDDVGSVGFVNHAFKKKLEAQGIKCRIFNPIIPFLKIFLNNRDHRKLMVIDGEIAFLGGYNLADEYFNVEQPYGLWKDSGVRLVGNAVTSVTGMFLEMWNFIERTDADYGEYMRDPLAVEFGSSYVQPYSDTPLGKDRIGESVYFNMIACARESLYICTPYLAIGEDMTRQLILAAQRGVDVRIVIPGVPDKKLVYELTKTYVPQFVQNGVRVYRFLPGFNHAKQVLADKKAAVVGTVNMDFRSFCHHFEDGVFLYGGKVIAQIEEDFNYLFEASEEITADSRIGRVRVVGWWQCVLRLLAPLL